MTYVEPKTFQHAGEFASWMLQDETLQVAAALSMGKARYTITLHMTVICSIGRKIASLYEHTVTVLGWAMESLSQEDRETLLQHFSVRDWLLTIHRASTLHSLYEIEGLLHLEAGDIASLL